MITLQLRKRSALPIAAAGMWVLASVGVWLLIRSGGWSILSVDDHLIMIGQLGAFYIAMLGAQVPAGAWVAFVISHSTFRNPKRVAAMITVVCGLFSCLVRALRGPWSGVAGVEWWMPLSLEAAGVLLLALMAVAFTWIITWMNRRANQTRQANTVARTVKSVITVCVLSLLLAACRHVQPEPERRSTEVEIRQHIVGEWTASDEDSWYPKLLITEDGRLFGVETNGVKELIGTWEMSGSLLRVTPTPTGLEAARVAGEPMNAWDYYPVVYADDHELVMAPGISVAGRWRYER